MFHDTLQSSVKGFKYYLSTWAFIETFLLSGHRAGWASLVYVLKKEGIYQYLCHNSSNVQDNVLSWNITLTFEDVTDNGTIASLEERVGDDKQTSSCPEQDAIFELCVSIYSVVSAPCSLFVGILNFNKGIRITRIASILLLLTGVVSFAVLTTDKPWLIFIGYIGISSGGMGVLQTNNQISYLFARFSSTVVGAICGAFDASGAVLLGVKLAYEHGIPLSTSYLVIGCTITMAVVSTFFLLPKDLIEHVHSSKQQNDVEEIVSQTKSDTVDRSISEKTRLMNRSRPSRSNLFSKKGKHNPEMGDSPPGDPNAPCSTDGQAENDIISSNTVPEKTSHRVLIQYIFSPLYFLQFIWISTNQLLFILFIGSLNAWLGHVTRNVEERVSHFTNFMYSTMLSAPIFSILSGASIDFCQWIQSDSRKESIKTLYSLAAPSAVTSIIGVAMCACIITEDEEVTYAIAVLSVVYRSVLYTYWGAFIRVIYPTNYFAGLYAVMLVSCGLVSFLQYPLFLWCQSSDNGYRQVYTLLGLLTMCTLTQPFYLFYTGWKESQDQTNPSN